jgi:TRAP-type C4-dicarboxylate transport system permease small subunit
LSRARFTAIADTLLAVLAAAVLFAMMALTFVDVILRYVFDAPLRGSFEITELMMVVLIMAGLPLVSRREEHVVLDVFDAYMSAGLRRLLRLAVNLVCSATMAGMGWLMWHKAGQIASYGDTTAALKITLAPYVYLMAALIFLTALIHLYQAFTPPGKATGTSAT